MAEIYDLLFSSAAVSFSLAEQFSHVMELRGLQSAARMGRAQGDLKYKNQEKILSAMFQIPVTLSNVSF